MNNKLFLTGVTGEKSGSIFIKYISDNINIIKDKYPGGISVICRETSNTKNVENLLPDAVIHRIDFKDVSAISKAMEDADTVVHIAGITQSREITDAAVIVHARWLIMVHTTGIYSKYKSVGVEYREIDAYVNHLCQKKGISLTILRPTMVYGNLKDRNIISFIRMVDLFPIMPIVRGARFELQPVNYKDLGKAYFDVLIKEKNTKNESYNLSGGAPIQLRDILSIIGKKLGKKVRFFNCPYWIAFGGSWMVYLVTLKRKDYREKVQRLCEARVFDYSKATKDFGYSPMFFEEGVVDEIEEYINSK